MADNTAAQRQAEYRARKTAQAEAKFAGATEIRIAWFGVNKDGHHVAIGYDGQPIELVVPKSDDSPVATSQAQVNPSKPTKVYAPKSWDADKWNQVVSQIQETDLTKEQAISQLSQGKTLDEKQRRQSVAVVEAMPDAPDWHASLPLAEDN